GEGGDRYFGGGKVRRIIWISTNGGVNWGFQQPDTSIAKFFIGIDFVNKDTGWSSWIRTNNGGGPVIYPTYIDSNSAVIPSDYVLKQNYPNPFNPSTTIEFSLPKDSYVKMKITDISGRTVFWVIYDMLLYSGLHRFKITDFSRLSLPSGVYFYRLEAREKNNGKTYFTPSRKMLYIK
ncbi:MAG: T9SS type A sorting domain-containing protein, partial [Candidatus Kapaibacterium sp.]